MDKIPVIVFIIGATLVALGMTYWPGSNQIIFGVTMALAGMAWASFINKQ